MLHPVGVGVDLCEISLLEEVYSEYNIGLGYDVDEIA